MGRIIGIVNQKGGVGKTTTAVNLAAGLAGLGRRVLLVDCDPQGNATTGLGIRKDELEVSMAEVLEEFQVSSFKFQEGREAREAGRGMRGAIVRTRVEGLDLVPSRLDLAGVELEMAREVEGRESRVGEPRVESPESESRESERAVGGEQRAPTNTLRPTAGQAGGRGARVGESRVECAQQEGASVFSLDGSREGGRQGQGINPCQRRLREALREIREESAEQRADLRYDYIIIDAPPSLGLLTVNCLVAADSLIIPVQCEYFALEGLKQLREIVGRVREGLNPGLRIEGMLLTMYDGRTRLSVEVAEDMRRHFGDEVFRTVIPRSVRLAEAPSYGMPGVVYAAESAGAMAYMELAREVESRESESQESRVESRESHTERWGKDADGERV